MKIPILILVMAAADGQILTAGPTENDLWTLRRSFRDSLAAAADFRTICRTGMNAPDAGIRRYALAEWYDRDAAGALPEAVKAAADPDPDVRVLAVEILGRHLDSEYRALLIRMARQDSAAPVRQTAKRALFPFYRPVKLLKDDRSYDYLVQTLATVELPAAGWKFQSDPDGSGHLKNYFAAEFDDRAWPEIAVDRPWSNSPADGIGFYRVRFKAVPPGKFQAFELVFPKVSDNLYVWLNGVYLGQRDHGGSESEEFRLDATAEVKTDAENVLVVRVEGPAGKGGILAPPRGEWMK